MDVRTKNAHSLTVAIHQYGRVFFTVFPSLMDEIFILKDLEVQPHTDVTDLSPNVIFTSFFINVNLTTGRIIQTEVDFNFIINSKKLVETNLVPNHRCYCLKKFFF